MLCGKNQLTQALMRMASCFLAMCAWPMHAAASIMQLNMSPGVTPISHDIYDLHMTIFWICVGIGVLVFGMMIYTLIFHRKSRGVKPATFHHNTLVEVIWMVIPLCILIIMAIPATLVLMRMDDDKHADVTIKITGYQWKWRYEYLNHGIAFYSNLSTPMSQRENVRPKGKWYLLEVDKPLVVPVHQKIRFLVTANDVIHSWWVPALGVKRDGIPGFIYEAWARIEKPGTYRGQCAELCGVGHAYMPIVVKAVTPAQYAKWLEDHGATNIPQHGQAPAHPQRNQGIPFPTMKKKALMSQGRKVYGQHCAVCHRAGGEGMPPTFPAIRGSKVATGPIKPHIHVVLHGRRGTAMQAFDDQLNDQEIAAVITYQRHAWGNANPHKHGPDAGGLVQPADVAAERDA